MYSQNWHQCRFCKSDDENEHGLKVNVHYGVRHWAHADCLLKAKGADAFTLLHDWQLDQLPYFAIRRAGLEDVYLDACRSRRERTA